MPVVGWVGLHAVLAHAVPGQPARPILCQAVSAASQPCHEPLPLPILDSSVVLVCYQ